MPILLTCSVTGLILLLLSTGRLTLGVAGEWVWKYAPVGSYTTIWFPCLVFLLFLYFLRKCLAWQRESLILGMLIVFALLFQLSIGSVGRLGLQEYIFVTMSPVMSGFFDESLKINNLGEFLRNYSVLMADFNFHARGYPPGPIIHFWSINKLFESFPGLANGLLNIVKGTLIDPGTAFMEWERAFQTTVPVPLKASVLVSSWMITFIGSLTIVPLYYLAKKLSNDKQTALYAASLYLLVPSIIMFAPGFDIVFPIFAVTALYLFYLGLVNQRSRYIWASGLVTGIGLFFTLAILVIPVLMCLIALSFFLRQRLSSGFSREALITSLQSTGVCILKLCGGVLIMIIIYRLCLQLNLFYIINECRNSVVLFYSTRIRSYYKWIGYNLIDFFLFTGIAVSIFFITKICSEIKKVIINKTFSLIDTVWLSFILILLLLNFSGRILGETARVWIFLAPIVIMVCADKLKGTEHRQTQIVFTVLSCQFIQTLMFKLFLDVHTL